MDNKINPTHNGKLYVFLLEDIDDGKLVSMFCVKGSKDNWWLNTPIMGWIQLFCPYNYLTTCGYRIVSDDVIDTDEPLPFHGELWMDSRNSDWVDYLASLEPRAIENFSAYELVGG